MPKPSALQAIRFEPPGTLTVLDQLLLPYDETLVPVTGIDDGHRVIKAMQVRGAPAIAIVAILSLVVDIHARPERWATASELLVYITEATHYLETSRPTAVNLFEATKRLRDTLASTIHVHPNLSVSELCQRVLEFGEAMLARDLSDNQRIGALGATWIQEQAPHRAPECKPEVPNASVQPRSPSTPATWRILTHCNTGALATAGWGTALGIARSLFQQVGEQLHVYCTETRPYMQGSRLTAYELVHDKIPATLITDSMAAALLASRTTNAIVVGADRVAANGDTANKIGTYQLAVVAHHHNVPFMVAAPWTSIDLTTPSGADIPIEERPSDEMVTAKGRVVPHTSSLHTELPADARVRLAAPGIATWNPAFDITPAHLISAIVTERGVITKSDSQATFDLAGSHARLFGV
ncbi:S-methyl-5-thioribose-1-phosphate isomerase [Dimargaris verticillata]|uniref:Methylthioribose-1-phosphate isomerase n=1 Tax=Dimargaris verticillata TaxID=2761393 RepID=A0A9W8B826_9FUNG|nr:S-methyl-5-thioribose-1-phosphate isomerase [Dimargaris verticillata]